ncbi:hypothetical protein Hanom_Chr05g00410471 [Helianthus anomalus]
MFDKHYTGRLPAPVIRPATRTHTLPSYLFPTNPHLISLKKYTLTNPRERTGTRREERDEDERGMEKICDGSSSH